MGVGRRAGKSQAGSRQASRQAPEQAVSREAADQQEGRGAGWAAKLADCREAATDNADCNDSLDL